MADAPGAHVTLVDPNARVARDASLGPGAVVGPGARVDGGARLGPNTVVAAGAVVGAGAELGPGVTVEAGAVVEAGAYLGPGVAILAGTRVGRDTRIEAGAVLGRIPRSSPLSTHQASSEQPPTVVGAGCMIGAHAVLYAGVTLARGVLVGDLASIREGVSVGAGSIVGRGTHVENDAVVGARVKIQTGCYITGHMVIEDDVFVGPHASTTNDKEMDRAKGLDFVGPTIRRGARIGSNCTLLPGVTVGVDALVGAGAVVTKDVPDFAVVAGVPARARGEVPPDMRLEAAESGPDG